MEKKEKPFGALDQFGFWFGDMAGSFVNLYFDGFFLLFCTYVLKVNPAFMASMFLVARLFDAFNDPVIGSFPDRWKLGKSGDKFKPYIKIAMWSLALSVVFGFADVSTWPNMLKHVWIVFTYILYGVSYTGTSMPFGAMASVVSDKTEDRTKLSRARAFGGMTVGFGYLSLVPTLIWDKDNNPVASGYFIFAVISAVLCIVCYNVLFKCTSERVRTEHKVNEKFDYPKVLKEAFKNRALLGIMFASIGSLIFITGNSQFGGFMYKEFYNAPKALRMATLGSIPLFFILFPLVPKLAGKFGKRNFLLAALYFNVAVSAFLFFVPIKNVNAYIVLYIISSIGQTVFIMLVWAFVTDAIDYHQYITGKRNDGSLYSIYTFSRKIGSTLASVGVSGILAAIGFVSSAAVQSEQVVANIRRLGTGVPFLAVILEIIGMTFIWNLSKEKTEEIQKALSERNEG